ncbi:MAG: TIGR00341 family protein [Flavobacteriaceae bacterium]
MESKFNFSEEDNLGISSKKSVSKNAKGFFQSLYIFFKETLDFRENTDKESTINSIKEDISIKGATAWILICSIFVASVGLNANSIPVVIGAMLISPLMGPILGFGMSIAINDLETLKRSLINFIVMVLLSVITAYLFFAFFPLREESSELLSRTSPDIRDVLIAFFGGLALIIAKTKKGTISSVIFGVAIATALMPPLCTVGYGLATGNIYFSSGAMYLFMINSLYIVLATYLVIKFLGFPMINYANSKRRALIARIVTFFSILMIIPAFDTFMDVLNESKFNSSAKEFLKTELDGLKNKDYLHRSAIIKYNSKENQEKFSWPWGDKESEIVLNTFGLEPISKEAMDLLSAKIIKYPNLSQTKIVFNQQDIGIDFKEQKRFLVELRKRDSLDLIEKNIEIEILNKKLSDFEKKDKINLLFEDILNEINIHFEEIEEIYYNESDSDSIPIFLVKWSNNIDEDIIISQEKKLKKWVSYKLSDIPFELIRK